MFEVLPLLAVDEAAQAQRVRIGDLVGRGDPRSDGRVRVEGFAEAPLRRAVLPDALGHVIADAIAEDMRGRIGFGDVAAALADDGDELDFVVDEWTGPWR